MIRPDIFLLGYRVFCVKEEDVALAAEILLKGGISVKFVKNSFVAGEKKSKKIKALLGTRVEFSCSELKGFLGFLKRHRSRWGVFVSLALTVLLFVVSQNRVWDVRVDGCSAENEEKIVEELEKCGFFVGTRWSRVELSDVEVRFLSSSDVASWVNINRRGTVAYVTVIEKISHPEPEVKSGYANIVASCDAVIEEITVMKGVAAVKAGDSVKKGDLLISGIISNEFGTEFCYAEGSVIGRVSDTISLSTADTEVKKQEKDRRLSKITVKIFKFSLNILNSSRNYPDECDIIDVTDRISIFGVKLPITVHKQYAVYYESVSFKLDASEMTRRAADEMSRVIGEKLKDATLVRIRTDGGFADGAYTLNSSIVYLENIGTDLSFEVVEK